jgi:hypothetical protein
MDIHVGTTFDNIIEAKTIIKAFVADTAESWKSTHSDKERFNIVCKQQRSCAFRIRATNSKKKGVSITHLQLILATQQATLELLIQTLQSIFFPIIKQLYEITQLSLQSKYNQLNDFSILIIFYIFKPIESSRLSLQRCRVISRNHFVRFGDSEECNMIIQSLKRCIIVFQPNR